MMQPYFLEERYADVYMRVYQRIMLFFRRDPARLHGHIRRCYGRNVLPRVESNARIFALLSGDKPVMISRFGSIELDAVRNYYAIERSKQQDRLKDYYRLLVHGETFFWKDIVRHTMAANAGFFPCTDAMMSRFGALYLEDFKQIDLLGLWFNPFESYVCRHQCSEAPIVLLHHLDPFSFKEPWTRALTHKKVLVIHPFVKTMAQQYAKRTTLFADPDMLPECDLILMQAVQSRGGGHPDFDTWFDAFDHMCHQIDQTDFDIAIIGAGGYGLPLAAYIKRQGKKAMHWGGATQLLFGIKGRRWDTRPYGKTYYNEHWTYPVDEETPSNDANWSYWK
jgi:hypothetical protein